MKQTKNPTKPLEEESETGTNRDKASARLEEVEMEHLESLMRKRTDALMHQA